MRFYNLFLCVDASLVINVFRERTDVIARRTVKMAVMRRIAKEVGGSEEKFSLMNNLFATFINVK